MSSWNLCLSSSALVSASERGRREEEGREKGGKVRGRRVRAEEAYVSIISDNIMSVADSGSLSKNNQLRIGTVRQSNQIFLS